MIGPNHPSNDDLRISRSARDVTRLTERQIDELIGLCKGVLCDGTVSEGEAEFLAEWLERNRQASSQWPGSHLYQRLRSMMMDRALSVSEQEELLDLLQGIAGSPISFTERAENTAAESIFDVPTPSIVFADHTFCRTGRFAFGSETAFVNATRARGGKVVEWVPSGPGFIVVGVYGSPEWKHASYGTKIATALARKAGGFPPSKVAIVREKDWVEALEKTPPIATP